MELKNWVRGRIPMTPESLSDKLLYATSCHLTDKELDIFNQAILCIEKQIEFDNIPHDSLTRVTCIFTETDEITILFNEDGSSGVYMPIIVFRINQWRKHKFGNLAMMTIILEELCHCYFHFEEEVLVKHKVIEIITRNYPYIDKDKIYRPDVLQ